VINVNYFFSFLKKSKVNFFSGVPDSILKETKTIFERMPDKNHVAAINEGVATSVCIGNHLATGNLPCVYLQNSGLGNAINPLISIAHKQVYSVPLLLLIGWRGAPGQKDEPQHLIKGKITKKLLNNLNIKFCQLKNNRDLTKLRKLINYSKKNKKPIACLVKKGVFYNPKKIKKDIQEKGISREIFIKRLLECIKKNTKIVSSTGYISRELHQIRKEKKISAGKDFYMVGGMGHAASLALGVSINDKKRHVICLDGDGALLMHLGSMANIGYYAKNNYKHIVLNNFSHESVGGQKTNIDKVDLRQVSLGLGYKKYFYLHKESKINTTVKRFLRSSGPTFLEVRIKKGSMKNLKRPKNLVFLKNEFMKNKI
tara:strand:- start:7760 stop:8872 length:1113 start_codon:yes stop_codon:yes gene_type:complete